MCDAHRSHDHSGHDHGHAGHDHGTHEAHGHAAHDHGHDHGGHSHSHAPSVTPGADDLAECPVMPGSTVVKAEAEAAGLFRDYEGERYWLCCAACGPQFDADPAKYAAA